MLYQNLRDLPLLGIVESTVSIDAIFTVLQQGMSENIVRSIVLGMLYSQLGITQGILDGTADEKTMLNYYNRTIEPILSAIADEMKRKFLTKTARSQRQSIEFFRDPFKLVPVSEISEIADKFTRNEIMTSNEIRQVIGMKPSDDPKADELRNKNLSESAADRGSPENVTPEEAVEENNQLSSRLQYHPKSLE